MRIILASQSPRRKQFLTQMGVDFEIIVPKCQEQVDPNLSFGQIVEDISFQKAKEVFDQTSGNRLVIGSDTIVVIDNKIMGKPKDKAQAKQMLMTLSGSHHHAYTGLCVLIERDGVTTKHTAFDQIEVFFKNMPEHIVDKYIATGEPMDKAGAYTIQGIGSVFIDKICGNPSAIVGLPVEKLYDIFLQENIDFLNFENK